MPDLADLPDLASDVRERAVPPPSEQVGRRVRARRRRGVTGTLAAAALVVGGVAVWQGGAPAQAPADPTTTRPSQEELWRSVVDGDRAHPFEVAGSDDGSVAIVWRSLVQPEPTFALVVRGADGTVTGGRLDAPVALTPVPGGWVAASSTDGWLVTTEGTWHELGPTGTARPPRVGDLLVQTGLFRALYCPDDRSWADLPTDALVAQYLTPDGHLLGCLGAGRVDVWRDAERVARSRAAGVSWPGEGDRVVVAALGDSPDGAIPLKGLLRSDDAGRTWRDVAVPAIESVTSVTWKPTARPTSPAPTPPSTLRGPMTNSSRPAVASASRSAPATASTPSRTARTRDRSASPTTAV